MDSFEFDGYEVVESGTNKLGSKIPLKPGQQLIVIKSTGVEYYKPIRHLQYIPVDDYGVWAILEEVD